MTSSDGGNFEEVACYRKTTRTEVSYEEWVMFDTAKNLKALTIAMRSPMQWQYFGINDVALIVEPYPFMLVNGITGEECIVATNGELRTAPCLDTIAEGSGSEVFQFQGEGQILNLASNTCIHPGGKLSVGKCNSDSSFEMASNGQLTLSPMGNYCVVASPTGVTLEDCSESVSGDKFIQVAVSEFDPNAAATLKNGASLLNAAAKLQQALLSKLQEVLPGCKLLQHGLRNSTHVPMPMSFRQLGNAHSMDAATNAVSRMYALAGIDFASLYKIIAATNQLL